MDTFTVGPGSSMTGKQQLVQAFAINSSCARVRWRGRRSRTAVRHSSHAEPARTFKRQLAATPPRQAHRVNGVTVHENRKC